MQAVSRDSPQRAAQPGLGRDPEAFAARLRLVAEHHDATIGVRFFDGWDLSPSRMAGASTLARARRSCVRWTEDLSWSSFSVDCCNGDCVFGVCE